MSELWTNSVDWFIQALYRQTDCFMGISGNMKVYSELFFIIVSINHLIISFGEPGRLVSL